MRLIPTRIHGLLDYVVALLLIVWPLLAGYRLDAPEAVVPIVLGAGTVGFSLFTDYEMSLARLIPMPVHLGLDMASGALLALSPWLFGFAERAWTPHLVIGLLEIGVAMTTATVASPIGAPSRQGVARRQAGS